MTMSIIFRFDTFFETPDGTEICLCCWCDYSPGRRGRYSGPPEKCYPDEPSEYSLSELRVEIVGKKRRPQPKLRPITKEELTLLGCETEEELLERIALDREDNIEEAAADFLCSRDFG